MRYDLYFRSIHPQSPSVYNPSRIAHTYRGVNTKVAILQGLYKDQSGVIVQSYYRLLFYKVLVYNKTILVIRQRDLKLLDPGNMLPTGYPLNQQEVAISLT